jgi:hypothetical protein
MFVLADELHATRFPIGLTAAVIRGQRATGPVRVVWLTGFGRRALAASAPGGEVVD